MRITGWGRLAQHSLDIRTFFNRNDVANLLISRPGLAHGLGRSYGDVAIADTIWLTSGLNRFIDFNEATGGLTVEAGVSLSEIQKLFVQRGWLLPVTPGTQFVTVGGAIANDVHGKNHHSAGTFGEHVTELTLARSDGKMLVCSKSQNAELFSATIGGLGLTGIITQATIRLKKVAGPWIDAEVIPFRNLDEFFEISDASSDFEYSVAWFDCLSASGHGLFTRGNHSLSTKPLKATRAKKLPFTPPFSLINRLTLRFLNSAYYLLGVLTKGKRTVSYQDFFYPLDGIEHWNRAYGPKGFYQHQSVLPDATARETLAEMLKVIRQNHAGSLLAVLKTTAEREHPGLLSFPIKGVTLALDFPNQGSKTQKLLSELEAIVLKNGGRLNPSKDATMARESFAKTYPRLSEFEKLRDPAITSHFSKRVIERKP